MTRPFSPLAPLFAAVLIALTGCQTSAPTRIDEGQSGSYQPPASERPGETRRSGETRWRGVDDRSTPARPSGGGAASSASSRSARASAEPRGNSNVILRTNQIEVTKTVTQPASVGGDLKYRIRVEALEDVGTVRVTERIPGGIRFGSADPAASLSGGEAVWTFPSIPKGGERTIDVTVRPTAEGDHRICSAVTVENEFCLNVFSGQPKLEVVKEGPATVELGEVAEWTVEVTNTGSAAATDVVVTDELPEAFNPTTGLRQEVGDLAPGETRTVTYAAKAVAQGSFRNRAVASYGGSGPDGRGGSGQTPATSAPVEIVQSGIRVRKSGPEEAYVFKPETYEIRIENTGDTDLKNVRITDLLPDGASVADNARGRVTDNAIGWMIPELPAGGSQLIATEIASTRTGAATNTVNVVTGGGLKASDSVTTDWLAVPGMTVSISDSKDPIRVRESTTYSIKVRNQGEFEPVTGEVNVRFSDTIRPVSVAGDAEGRIDGQNVTFPRTTLEPGRDTDLSITAEGAAVGPGKAILNFTADFLAEPTISEESTNVY